MIVALLLLALYEKVPLVFIVFILSPRTLYLLSVLDTTNTDLPLDAKLPDPEVMTALNDFPEIVVGADTFKLFESLLLSPSHPAIARLNNTPVNRVNFFILFIHVLWFKNALVAGRTIQPTLS
jgi:hypothetical protein